MFVPIFYQAKWESIKAEREVAAKVELERKKEDRRRMKAAAKLAIERSKQEGGIQKTSE
jgi:hypothetical protein